MAHHPPLQDFSVSPDVKPYNRTSAWVWATIVGVFGMAFAIIAGLYHRNAEIEAYQAKFDRESAFVYTSISQQIESGGQLARAIQASFMMTPGVKQKDLDRVYDALEPKSVIPGLKAISYAKKVPGEKGEGYRYLNEFVLPREGNEGVVGMHVEIPSNIDTIHRSELHHSPVLSPVFNFKGEGWEDGAPFSDGVMIRVPVYSDKPSSSRQSIGSIGVSFHLNTMINAALEKAGNPTVAVRLVDATASNRPLIFQSGVPGAAMVRTDLLSFGERDWEISISQARGVDIISIWPGVTMLGGLTAAFLLASLVFNLLSGRARAQSIAEDMSEKYQISEERFRLLNEHLPGIVLLADESGDIVYANRVCRTRLGVLEEAEHQTLFTLFKIDKDVPLDHSRGDRKIRMIDREGQAFWVSLSVSSLLIEGKLHWLALGSDVTDIMELSEQLEFQSKQLQFQATHDTLTGLLNRRAFEDALDIAIASHREDNSVPVLLYVDLDQFKIINDTAGHIAGDALLLHASDGLRRMLGGEITLSRLGGDEFGILMPRSNRESAIELAETVRKFFEKFQFDWEGLPHRVSCSIGINLLEKGQTRADFLARADTACYLAKEKGRNRWHMFESAGDSESAALQLEMGWVARIRSAIEEDRLSLYYQDLVPLNNALASGAHFELLVRMHDENGVVAASEFIPAAERYGLMDLVDRWVLKQALMNFDQLHPSGCIETCAINLSAQTISDPNFEEFLVQTLESSQMLPHKLCLEITETSAIRNMDILAGFLPGLRARGCRIALDDFGAGMSSFGYLKNLHADIVKIDGSFIRDVDHDARSQAIVNAVVSIAHEMGMQVVAEWITSQEVLDYVSKIGVDYGQGYFLGTPQPCPIKPQTIAKLD